MKIWLTHNPVPLNRIFFVCLIACILLSVGIARQQEALEVYPPGRSQIEAKPGSVVATAIRVINKSTDLKSCIATPALPAGWKLVIPEFPFEIQPRDTSLRLITISIPPDAPAGRYTVRYSVQDRSSIANEVSTSIDILVLRVVQLQLKLLDAPRFVVAGTTFSTKFVVMNQGNSTDAVRLRFRSSHNFPVRLDSTVIHLAPKETREVQLYVPSDTKLGRIDHTLELEARSGLDTTVRVKASSVVEIIPGATTVDEAYLMYPVTVRLREVGQDGILTTQAEIHGIGSLNEKKTDELEFLFRARETQSISNLGERDEYRVSYRANNLELFAGDHSYSLSTLTEVGRYATGIGGKGKVGKISMGGFYNQTRWMVPSQKEAGGFVNYDLRRNITVGVNYLNKRDQFSSNIVTLRSLVTPLTGSNLDVELGTGSKSGKQDNAYAARFDGSRKWLSYDLRYVRAGSDFWGYYRDINFFSASVNVQPLKNVRVLSYLRLENRNLARDTSQAAPRDNYYQIGAGYSDYISIFYRGNSRNDQLENPKYRTQEDAVQARLGYNFPFANVYTNIDIGTTHDKLQGKRSPYKRLALYSSFRPFAKQNYNTSFEYSTRRDIFSGEDIEQLSASLNAHFLFGQSTQAQLNLYGSRIIASYVQTYSMLDASIEHEFPFHHKVAFHGRLNIVTTTVTNREAAYTLEYEIPIGIPIKRITGVGQLRGSIKDEKGRGIANVLINIGGEAALSDVNGAFFFQALKPGTAYLTVDKASIGFNRITTQPMPMELLVRGGEESKIALSVNRSVTIGGKVTLYGTGGRGFGDTSTALIEIGGKSGVFLEISSGNEVHRRVSDNRGRFLFSDLRPGTWFLKVTGGDIPEYHTIEPDTITLDLMPGERKDVNIELRPRRRTIKILQGGTLIPEAPVEEEKKIDRLQINKGEGKSCVVIYDEKKDGYVLQISSWSRPSLAQQAARRAEKMTGLRTFIEPANIPSVGRRYRVFIGVFKSMEEAIGICHKYTFK